jgi:hypothetical protein
LRGRKGIDLLVTPFARAFRPGDGAGLVIKEMGSKSFYRGQTAEAVERRLRVLAEADLARPEAENVPGFVGWAPPTDEGNAGGQSPPYGGKPALAGRPVRGGRATANLDRPKVSLTMIVKK